MVLKILPRNPFALIVVLALYLSPAVATGWQLCHSQPNGAVLPVPSNCHFYIHCLHQTAFTKVCPLGKAFKRASNSCDDYTESDCLTKTVIKTRAEYARQGTCENEHRPENKVACKRQTFGELVPYPGNCSKFLVCNCEYPTVKQCPSGTWFDNTIKTCNYPHNVNCTEDNEGSTSTSEIMNTTIATTAATSEWGRDCEAPAGVSSAVCLKYPEGFLLSYPYNCSAYINCTKGCPVISYCPDDKVFNAFLEICDTPDMAQCNDMPLETTTSPMNTEKPASTSITTEILNNSSTTSQNTTSNSTSTTEESMPTKETTTINPDECITPPGIGTSIWSAVSHNIYQYYPYNCTAYILCKPENCCLKYCEDGKIFNSVLVICDEDIECHMFLPTTPATESTTTDSTTAGNTNCLPPNVDPGLCRGEKHNTVHPYEEDCSRYLLCENGEVTLERCPNGWFFNAILMLCDNAGEDICLTITNTTTDEPVTITTASAPPVYELCLGQDGVTFPYEQNCQLYYYCLDYGHYYIVSCPYNNFYDPDTGDCGPEVSQQACRVTATTTERIVTETTALSASERCAGVPAGTTYAYKENCSKYIYCLGDGGFLIMNCPFNNYYYPDAGDCGPSSDKNICLNATPATTSSTAQTTSSISMTTTTTESSTKPFPVSVCYNYSIGQLIAYPDNYEKYISCVEPIPIAFCCNNNWHFSEQQQICVENSESNCTGLPHNETTTTITPAAICQGLKKGDRQIYYDNCQLYYECLGEGFYMLKACTQREYYDPIKEECSSRVGANYCQQNFDTTSPPTISTTGTPTTQSVCEGQAVGWKVAYPHNCSKYILCETPIPVAFKCATGLEFSLETQECVVASQSDCGIATTTPATSTSSKSTTTPPLDPYNQCTDKADFTLLAYDKNCSLFAICLHGMDHLAHCKKGQYFDVTLGECITNANEDSCRLSSTAGSSLDICYNKPYGTKIPYPSNCTKYIECQDPLNVAYECPHGLEFSTQDKKCVWPELSNCSISATASPLTTTENSIIPSLDTCENMPTGSTLVYSKDCSKYYICVNGQSKLTYCMPSSYYNPNTGECDNDISPDACRTTSIITSSSESSHSPSCTSEINGFMYADEENCSQYYMCWRNESVLCLCHFNSFYNPQRKVCDNQIPSTGCRAAIMQDISI